MCTCFLLSSNQYLGGELLWLPGCQGGCCFRRRRRAIPWALGQLLLFPVVLSSVLRLPRGQVSTSVRTESRTNGFSLEAGSWNDQEPLQVVTSFLIEGSICFRIYFWICHVSRILLLMQARRLLGHPQGSQNSSFISLWRLALVICAFVVSRPSYMVGAASLDCWSYGTYFGALKF